MKFVSNAVMTGFATGIALQITAGVIKDATGYKPDSHNTIGKFVDAFAHVESWLSSPCLVALATVAVCVVLKFVKPLEANATLIALVLVTAVVTLMRLDVGTVGDIAQTPNMLPPCVIPNFAAIPDGGRRFGGSAGGPFVVGAKVREDVESAVNPRHRDPPGMATWLLTLPWDEARALARPGARFQGTAYYGQTVLHVYFDGRI